MTRRESPGRQTGTGDPARHRAALCAGAENKALRLTRQVEVL